MITGLGSDRYSLQLDDSTDDDDYNDLCIEVGCSSSSPASEVTALAAEQLEISDAIIDLTSIPDAGKNLKITENGNGFYYGSLAMKFANISNQKTLYGNYYAT